MRNIFDRTPNPPFPARRGGLIFAAILFSFPALFLAGCSERETPTEIETHVEGWSEKTAHGARIADSGPENCRTCHGTDLAGDDLVVGCYECHAGPGGHSRQHMEVDSAGFHARLVETDGNSECTTCHGDDFRGGWSEVSCYSCHGGGESGHPDPAEWFNSRSSLFHGKRLREGGVADCGRCHGHDLTGGTSGVSCAECHSTLK